MEEDKICRCRCHTKGSSVRHMKPCCDYTYEKYIDEDGSIDYKEYNKIVEKHKK